MKERRPSREELRQREKEELSRQKLQDQAFLETQRNVFARIQRGEDYWDGRTIDNWDLPSADWSPPPAGRDRQRWRDSQEIRHETDPRPTYDWDDTPVRRDPFPDDRLAPPLTREFPAEDREAFADKQEAPQSLREDPEIRREAARPNGEEADTGWDGTHLNPLIADMQWDEPEVPKTGGRKKKRVLLVVALILAVLLVAAALIHLVVVRAPELPSAEADSAAPGLMEAGRKEGVYTFLLVGRDDGGGGNTDTIMVGCFDTVNGTVDVLSIFRDTLVDVPWEIKKINSVYNAQGIEGLQTQVKNLIGYVPDYYFVVELGAVAQLVDAIGGVDYDIPYNMDYDDPTQDLHIHFAQGMQHLNGEDAVKVLRWRKNNSGDVISVGDVGRVEIQHDFLKSMAKQTISLGNVTKIRKIARIVDSNLTSDLSYGEMFWFGEQALGIQEDGIRFHSLPGDYSGSLWSQTYQNYQSYVFVNDSELLTMINQSMNPYLEDIPAESQHVLNGTTVSSQSTLP